MNPDFMQFLMRLMQQVRGGGLGPFTNGFPGQGLASGGFRLNPQAQTGFGQWMGRPAGGGFRLNPEAQARFEQWMAAQGYGGGQPQAPRTPPPPFGTMPANSQGRPMAMQNSNSPWAQGVASTAEDEAMGVGQGPGMGRGMGRRVRVQ
jgi:hypothetical protein